MTHAFVIQIAGRTDGIIARAAADQACHFFASSPANRVLETFREPERAERAVRKVHGGQRARPSGRRGCAAWEHSVIAMAGEACR